MKRNYSNAFNIAAGTYLANSAFKRFKTGFSLLGQPTQTEMARSGFKQRKRFRGRTKTITKRRRKYRRGMGGIKRRVRRISRTMYRKGLNAVEIKYKQFSEGTNRNNAGSNVLYGISEAVLQGSATSFPLTAKNSPSASIAIGSGKEQRVGNRIFLRHLRIKGGVWANTSANAANEVYVRIMVVRWKQAQGDPTTQVSTVPTADNTFDSVNAAAPRYNGTGINTTFTLSADNYAYVMANFSNQWKYMHNRWKNDYQILWKKTIKVSKETGVNAEKRFFKANIPIFKPASFAGVTDTDAQDGHIYIYYWCDCVSQNPAQLPFDGTFSALRPSLGYTYRLSWTDL